MNWPFIVLVLLFLLFLLKEMCYNVKDPSQHSELNLEEIKLRYDSVQLLCFSSIGTPNT